MTRPLVLATSRSFSSGDYDAIAALEDAGMRFERADTTHDLQAMRPQLAEAFAWIAGTAPVTAAHMDAAPGLKIIARYGVGTESVDLGAAIERDILVTNTPDASTGAVADLALGLMLAALRGIPAGDAQVRAGDWSVRRGRELGGATVGVIGFGRIGRAVTDRLRGFGCTVLAHDPWVPAEAVAAHGAEAASLDEIAARAEVVTLHTPGTELVVTAAWLAALARPAVLVNAARASVVDETAIAAALRDGRLAAYASDTLADEHDGGSPLLAEDLADRTVVTPHAGASTREAVDRMGRGTVESVLVLAAGGSVPNIVRPR